MHIPVVILTSSQAEEDILRSYRLHANCFITKPVDLEQLTKVVQGIEQFWFTLVQAAAGGLAVNSIPVLWVLQVQVRLRSFRSAFGPLGSASRPLRPAAAPSVQSPGGLLEFLQACSPSAYVTHGRPWWFFERMKESSSRFHGLQFPG